MAELRNQIITHVNVIIPMLDASNLLYIFKKYVTECQKHVSHRTYVSAPKRLAGR